MAALYVPVPTVVQSRLPTAAAESGALKSYPPSTWHCVQVYEPFGYSTFWYQGDGVTTALVVLSLHQPLFTLFVGSAVTSAAVHAVNVLPVGHAACQLKPTERLPEPWMPWMNVEAFADHALLGRFGLWHHEQLS